MITSKELLFWLYSAKKVQESSWDGARYQIERDIAIDECAPVNAEPFESGMVRLMAMFIWNDAEILLRQSGEQLDALTSKILETWDKRNSDAVLSQTKSNAERDTPKPTPKKTPKIKQEEDDMSWAFAIADKIKPQRKDEDEDIEWAKEIQKKLEQEKQDLNDLFKNW